MHATANPDYMPRIKVVDDAIRRRILVVPAGETLLKKDQDAEVKRSLMRDELSGILAALIDAAVRYYNEGRIEIPKAVEQATADYFLEADPVGRWINERCERYEGRTAATHLYNDFNNWWKATGQRGAVLTMTSWGRSMAKLGFDKQISSIVYRVGIRLALGSD